MASYSSSSRRSLHSFSNRLDYYKVLRVSRDASASDIKLSYRQLAMEYHPDRHDGCSDKAAQFKQINEAYSVLTNVSRKRQYDSELGRQEHNPFRTKTTSYAHTKVYAPSPPPEWNQTVWNHKTHYDMHYGDGFQQEAFRRMRESFRKEGAFEYQSPLGRGFSFDTTTTTSSSSEQVNPYSKAQQGPPKIVMEYEEIDRDMASGKEHVWKRERIVEDMYQRRQERYNSSDSRQQQGGGEHTYSTENAAFARRKRSQDNECIIL